MTSNVHFPKRSKCAQNDVVLSKSIPRQHGETLPWEDPASERLGCGGETKWSKPGTIMVSTPYISLLLQRLPGMVLSYIEIKNEADNI